MAVSTGIPKVNPSTVQCASHNGCEERKRPCNEREHSVSNEYVLNVAFVSFFIFTVIQFFFAILAKSQSMMADCAAMSVDVLSYFVNFLAERLKHGNSTMTVENLRLRRLFLELIPPLVSVLTLVVVTIMALRVSIDSLIDAYKGKKNDDDEPDVHLMLLFSALNMVLDFLNVTCFARVDQAVGLPGQNGHEDIHVHFEHKNHPPGESGQIVATETSCLVAASSAPATLEPQSQGADDESLSLSSEVETSGMNLNMCSAWTHVCADTLRSIAVLMAAGFSTFFPETLTPVEADSWGAIVVSLIILASLAPLIQGLYFTALKIRDVWSVKSFRYETQLKDNVIEV